MSGFHKDVILSKDAHTEQFLPKHHEFLLSYAKNQNSYEYVMSEWLRASGVYWCLTALQLLHNQEINEDALYTFVMSCWNKELGGFGASEHHDPHLLYTLSAIQILIIINRLDEVDNDEFFVAENAGASMRMN